MFLNCKRQISLIVIILFFLIPIQVLFSQQKKLDVKEYKELIINGSFVYLPIYKNKKQFLPKYVIPNPSNKEFIAKWDNQNFNPYRGEKITYPFQLAFESTNFSSPVDRKMVVTSRYGLRRGRPHQGIDIDLHIGDSVKSVLDGKVRYVGYHGGHGKTVIVRHRNGLETVYAHLSKYLVKENEEVKKGQAIGKGGITGNSRGSHLHLEVRYHGKSVNPEYLFEFTKEAKIRSDILYVTRKWMNPRYHRSTRKSNVVVHKTIDDITIQEEQKQKTYIVKKGDTLHRIANRHGLAVSEICKKNSIKYNAVLKIGQQIIVN
ncbi:LysM peptidoglycan-binding domain-containing protein [Aquimarina sp. AD10]|uniref:LysM domain-containing protein n=1 Tax=Aquimarina aggregata TaxID=1642818 RepID=A0A163CDE3_9FLAO|nr:LysM peptidoglycan-binding domain-containing protein [Aquimarina sp. AD10]KZS42293.1 hypothetical protein AWE51_02305 [Aquimarina aggregata]